MADTATSAEKARQEIAGCLRLSMGGGLSLCEPPQFGFRRLGSPLAPLFTAGPAPGPAPAPRRAGPQGGARCPATAAPGAGRSSAPPLTGPSRARRGSLPGLAQARGGHVGRRGAAAGPVSRRPRQRRGPAAPRGASGKGRRSRGRRGTTGRRGGPGRRRPGPSRQGGGGSGVGASAAAEGAAVGGAAGAVRGAGAGAALLRPLPALLDVRWHPRPRRAAAGRAERLLRLQPRLCRHRRDSDGRAAGAGAALPARRREVATGPAGTAALRGRPPLPPPVRATDLRKGGEGARKGAYFYAKRRLRLSTGPVSPGAVRSRIKP